MPQWRTGLGGSRQRCRDPGQDFQVDAVPLCIAGLVQGFKHGSSHGKHPRITRGHHHHRTALGGQFEGMARALHFFAVVGAMQHLIVAKRPGHPHIGFVPQDVIGPRQLGLDRRHHQLGCARPEADNGQATPRTANQLWVQRRRGDPQQQTIARLMPHHRQYLLAGTHEP